MKKETALEILSEIKDEVQIMREEGESDLRSVIFLVDQAIKKVESAI